MASAALLTYEVTVSSIASGPFAGQSVSARFSFDDSLIPAGGTGTLLDANGLNIPDLSVSYGTKSFTEANADAAVLEFHGGILTGFFLGAELNGLFVEVLGTDDFYLLAAGGGVSQQGFGYTVIGDAAGFWATTSGLTYRLVSVPEPSASALTIVGIVALTALVLRRRIVRERRCLR